MVDAETIRPFFPASRASLLPRLALFLPSSVSFSFPSSLPTPVLFSASPLLALLSAHLCSAKMFSLRTAQPAQVSQ